MLALKPESAMYTENFLPAVLSLWPLEVGTFCQVLVTETSPYLSPFGNSLQQQKEEESYVNGFLISHNCN